MGIVLHVPDDIAVAAQDLAAKSGLDANRVLLDALRAHFPPVPPELRAEFDSLERASDHDFLMLSLHDGL